MILGSVQGIETEPFGLYLGGFGHRKTDLAKDRNDLAPGIGERMGTTVQSRIRGQGGVDLLTEGFEVRLFLQDGQGIGKELLGLFLGLVESLAKGRFFLFGKFSYSFGRLRQASVRAKYGCFGLFPIRT